MGAALLSALRARGGAPPPWTPANLPPGVLVGWDGRTAADLTLVSGKISAWRDRASGNHLVQATDSNRPLAGFSTLGRGIAVWGNGSSARLITGSDIAAVKYAYCVATFFAPPSTRSNGDELAAFSGAYQSYLTIRGVANPSHGAIVGDIGTDDLYAAAPLNGSFYIDGVLTSPPSVGRQGRRRVVEVHFATARPVGPLGALVYGTDGTPLPAEGALHEIVLLSASASADDRANVRTYLTDYHLAAPVVVCTLDSLSACVNISTRQSWPWLLHRERYGGTVSVVNLGFPGQLVTTATSGDPAKLASVKGTGRNVLVLLGGANDILDGASAATVWTRLQAYISMAVTNGWQVVLCSVPNGTEVVDKYTAAHLVELGLLRDLIAAGWSAAGAARYVDLYALSLTRQADGIHLTSGDCTTVANEIGLAVDELLAA